MHRNSFLILQIGFLAAMVCFNGCLAHQQIRPQGVLKQREDLPQQRKDLESVASAMSGHEVNQQDLKKVVQDLKNDKDSRSAVESVSNSLGGQGLDVKYCPVNGKRFSARLKLCPQHNVPLLPVEN